MSKSYSLPPKELDPLTGSIDWERIYLASTEALKRARESGSVILLSTQKKKTHPLNHAKE